ncbi:hypothetical protein LQW54_008951 [Pestalotiopsis sp. IQ-011]
MGKVIPKYVLASVAVSLGGLINGYDTGSVGAVMEMDQFTKTMGHLSPFLVGFSVSLIMLTGAVPSVFGGQLADSLGRLKVITLGAVLFGVGAAIEGSASSLVQFLAGRAIAGFGQGVFLSNVSVYICEIAPVKHRGILAGLPQFMATAGICVGYFTCYGTVSIQSGMAWRIPYIIQCVISALFVAGCMIIPDSPRWLMLHGRRQDALVALDWLDFSMVEAERDFLTATEQRSSLSLWQNLVLLFRRLSSSTASFLASGVSAILMLAISIPAFLLADKWGRRTSAITGGLGLGSLMLLIGSLYAAGVVHPYGAARWVVIVSVFAFGLTYCATWGIVGKIYASEIQPSNTRAAANSVAQGLAFFTNWLVAILTPILLDKSAFGAYFLFGGLALGTVAVLAVYMPETRGRSLEEIQNAFHQPGIKNLVESLRRRFQQKLGPAGRENIELTDAGNGSLAVPDASGSSLTGLRLAVSSA